MRLELPQQPSRVVMYAMKKAASKTPHYVISLEQDDLKRVRHERGEKSFLGKLRAGVNNSEYLILDGGANPNDLFEDDEGGPMGGGAAAAEAKAAGGDSYLESKVRREHGCIIYNFKKRENQGVESRKMEVVVPTVSAETGGAREWRSTTKLDDSIFATFNRVRFKVMRACAAAAAAACLPAACLPAACLPPAPAHPPPSPPSQSLRTWRTKRGCWRSQGGQNILEKEKISCFNLRVSRYDALSSCLIDFKVRPPPPSVQGACLLAARPLVPCG